MFSGLIALLLLSPEAPFEPGYLAVEEAFFSDATPLYGECISLINADPETGRDGARKWYYDGGGAPALHCLAVADLASGYPRLAAVRFTEISERGDAGDLAARATVLGQAALAWLDANEPGFALETADAAIALAPELAELLIVQAKAFAANEQWTDTANAVSAAEEAGAVTAESHLLRAKARRALGKDYLAAEDVVEALKIDPLNLDALVLRGELAQAGIVINANYLADENTSN